MLVEDLREAESSIGTYIESIVETTCDYAKGYACDVACMDDDIEVQLNEYNRCSDPDYRLLYYEDLHELVGRRGVVYDEVYDAVETGREALYRLQEVIDAALEDLDKFAGSDNVPQELDVTVPALDAYPD